MNIFGNLIKDVNNSAMPEVYDFKKVIDEEVANNFLSRVKQFFLVSFGKICCCYISFNRDQQ